MSISKELIEAVNSKNVTLVRIILKNSLIMDPTFKEFDEEIAYAEKNINNLYEEYDGYELEENKSKWNKDYMDEQLNNLLYNFSKKRINHLKDICRVVYEDKIRKINQNNNSNNMNNNKAKVVITKPVATTVTIGGTVALVAGIVIGKNILVVSGAAAAIVGGVSLISNNSK